MRLALAPLVATIALAVFAPPVQSFHYCGDPPTYDLAGAAYVTLQHLAGEDMIYPRFAVHAETNSEPGLQRGGTTLYGQSDSCPISANPDLLVEEFWW